LFLLADTGFAGADLIVESRLHSDHFGPFAQELLPKAALVV